MTYFYFWRDVLPKLLAIDNLFIANKVPNLIWLYGPNAMQICIQNYMLDKPFCKIVKHLELTQCTYYEIDMELTELKIRFNWFHTHDKQIQSVTQFIQMLCYSFVIKNSTTNSSGGENQVVVSRFPTIVVTCNFPPTESVMNKLKQHYQHIDVIEAVK